jgi:hypothetical protein
MEDPREFLIAAGPSGRLIGIDGGTKTLGLGRGQALVPKQDRKRR